MAKYNKKFEKAKKITIWVEAKQHDQMHVIYLARGIPISEQMRRALSPYLFEMLADLKEKN